MSAFGRFAKSFWEHPAGPQTIHFWAPTFKWCVSLANVKDLERPPELISFPQQLVIVGTGLIFTRYGSQIIPINYNVMAVNFSMAVTGAYQLFRKYRYEQEQKTLIAAA